MKRQLELLPLKGKGGPGRGQGSKGKWNHMPTVVIRVPIKFEAQLLTIARQMDQGLYIKNDVPTAIALLEQLQDWKTYPRNKGGAIAKVAKQALDLLKASSL